MKRIVLLGTLVLSVFYSNPLWGEWRRFLPRIDAYTGELELYSVYNADEKKSDERTIKLSDMANREQIHVALRGYLYHPRFILFRMKGSAGLQEEYFDNRVQSSWRVKTAETYDFRAIALPKHPYNLEVFTLRDAPLLIQRRGGGANPIRHQSGAYLRYKKLPWGASLGYINEEASQSLFSSESDIYQLHLSYVKRPFAVSETFREPFVVNLDYEHSDTNLSVGTDLAFDHFTLDNTAQYKILRLISQLRYDKEKQTEADLDFFQLRRGTWREALSVDLPWNFASGLSFLYDTNKNLSKIGATGDRLEAFSDSRSVGFQLNHHLYRSLRTSLSVSHSTSDSTGGENDITRYLLRANYTKKIPGGRLASNFWTGLDRTKRKGAPSAINVAFTARLQDSFILTNQNIDITTVTVSVRDPFTEERVDIEEGEHFLLSETGDGIEILIISLPAEILQTEVDFVYDFLVSYTFLLSNYELETSKSGYSFQLFLYRDSVSPFFAHSESSQKLLAGTFPSALDRIKSETLGITLRQDPFPVGARLEYQDIESRINPERRWMLSLDYRRKITKYSMVNAKFDYEKKEYPRGRVLEGEPFTEKIYSGHLSYRGYLPKKNINFAITGFASKREGLVNSMTYSLNGFLGWHVGRLEIRLGASHGESRSESKAIGETVTVKDTTVYLKAKRKLF